MSAKELRKGTAFYLLGSDPVLYSFPYKQERHASVGVSRIVGPRCRHINILKFIYKQPRFMCCIWTFASIFGRSLADSIAYPQEDNVSEVGERLSALKSCLYDFRPFSIAAS
jgi:hypothetical protein